MNTASLAIWNMKKIVIAIASSTWGVGFIFQIQSKPSLPFGGSSEPHFNSAIILATVRVSNQPEL
jgi:hypothetical protein